MGGGILSSSRMLKSSYFLRLMNPNNIYVVVSFGIPVFNIYILIKGRIRCSCGVEDYIMFKVDWERRA